MRRFPLKKLTIISSLCLAMILPTPVHAYDGVIRSEQVNYQSYGTFYQKREVETIGKGVEHITVNKLTPNGWVDIHVLKTQMATPNLMLKSLRSKTWQKKEKLKDMADASDLPVLGAVNASYFGVAGEYSESQGFEYDNGLVHMDTLLRAGLFQDKTGKLFFSHTQKLQLIDPETNQDLDIVFKVANNLPWEGAAIYNDKVISDSSSIDQKGAYYKVQVKNETVVAVIPSYSTAYFDSEGYTIVFPENMIHYIQELTVGRAVRLQTESGIALDWLKLAIPGGGYVLRNGVVATEGELVQPQKRHPRTALGIDADNNLYMMVVDGRGTSIGATHYELAEYLKEFGVVDAITMDGGGSSELLARNLGEKYTNIENQLPANYQRKLINGLAVVSTAETGTANRLIVTANKRKTFAGMPISLEVRAIDDNQNPVDVDNSQIVWAVAGVEGQVLNNQFTPTTTGRAEVTAYYNNLSETIFIDVTGDPVDLKAVPSILEISGKQASFKLIGTDASGFVGEIPAANASYKLEDETVGYFTNGVFIPSKKGGNTRVTITVGNRSVIAYLVGAKPEIEIPEFLETPIQYVADQGVEGQVTISHRFGYHDSNSLAFSYHFPLEAYDSKTIINHKPKIEMRYTNPVMIKEEPESLSSQVYGDQSLLKITADIQDSQGNIYSIPLSDGQLWDDWKYVYWNLPKEIVYPAQVLGFTLENMESLKEQIGQIYIDDFKYIKKSDFLITQYQEFPYDPLHKNFNRNPDITLFGATGGRNRLLDSVIMEKAIQDVNKSPIGIYAGWSDLSPGQIRSSDHVWNNTYAKYDLDQTRVIHLAAIKGSYKNADPSQFSRLYQDLTNTLVDNIIIVSEVDPLEEKKHQREAGVVHEMLSHYAQSSGKNIYYIVANGYDTKVTMKDKVRYIKTSGLWYKIKNTREIDLNRGFYDIRFYLEGKTLYYEIGNLFPLVE